MKTLYSDNFASDFWWNTSIALVIAERSAWQMPALWLYPSLQSTMHVLCQHQLLIYDTSNIFRQKIDK